VKKEQIFELMNAVPPDLVEEADIQAPVKRRFSKGVRGALIAACLCLALVGTAFAVTELADLNMRVYWTAPFSNKDGASVEFAVDFYPLDSFTQELIALGAEDMSQQCRYFNNWDEMQAFVGVEVVHNPVLDSAEPGPKVGNPWNQDWLTHVLLVPVSTEDGELRIIQENGSYLVDGIRVEVFAAIYTERAAGTLYYSSKGYPTTAEGFRHVDGHYEKALGDGIHARFGMEYGKDCEVTQETYTTPNGLDVLIIQAFQPDTKETSFGAHFLMDGVLFQVATWVDGTNGALTTDHAMEVLKTVLDGFEV
jgi:hypothetical protein